MNNKPNTSDTLARMKSLMNYGRVDEKKESPYSTLEYQKLGADEKSYAIIREGKKYFIKVADNKPNLVKEDYNYIGGFRNRMENAYDSFANAQKQFDLKMMSIKEAVNNKKYNPDSWNLEKKEGLVVEATDKMKEEIFRQKQIMRNAALINENKEVECDGYPFCEKSGEEYNAKDNVKKADEDHKFDGPKKDKSNKEADLKKTDLQEGEELAWHDSNGDPKNDHYMDMSHGTEIGDGTPFGHEDEDAEDDILGEGEVMHTSQNQNNPAVGVGEGPSDHANMPFDDEKGKDIDEDEEFETDDVDAEGGEPMEDDFGAEEDFEGADDAIEDVEPAEDAEEELDDIEDDEAIDDVEASSIEDRLSDIEDVISLIAKALNIDEPQVDADDYEGTEYELFTDDDEDDDEEGFGDEDFEDEEGFDDEEDEDDIQYEGRRGVQVVESAGYRRAVRRMMNEEGMEPFSDAGRVPSGNMNKLNVWGKHPAYQKKVMSYPRPDIQDKEGYYDMNDDSVRGEKPYGEYIGDSMPFDIDVETADNAIAESIRNFLKKK